MTASQRRLALPGLLSALVLTLAAVPGHAASPAVSPGQPSAAPGSDLTPVTALPAGALTDSVGVNVHLGFLDTPYRDAAAVTTALQDLGVHHVRDEFRLDQPRQWESLRALAAAGISSDLIVGPRPDQRDPDGRARADVGTPQQHVDTIARELAGTVDVLEGTNEWDLWGGSSWVSDLHTWQRALYDAAKAAPALEGVPVLAPSVALPRNWATAGSFAGMADAVNAHLYPGGRQPGGLVEQHRDALGAQAPGLPLVVTETGYHDATGSPDTSASGHPGTPEAVVATYLPRLLAGNLAAGVRRTYLYELLDQFPDVTRTMNESHFGLLRNDLTPKPAARSLQDLLRLAAGGTSTTATAGSAELGLAVDGAPADLRRLVLQRPDGSFLVLLWRDVATWDPDARTTLPVTPSSVTVRLDRTGPLQVQRPGAGTTPLAAGTGDRVELSLGAELTAVVVGGDPVAPVTAPARSVSAAAGQGAATVTWAQPEAQVGVTVAYDVAVTPGGSTTRVLGSSRSHQVALKAGAAYRLSVTAVTATGRSAAVTSDPVLLLAPPMAAPQPPATVLVAALRHAVEARWPAAVSQGAPVTGYEVRAGRRVVVVPATRHQVRLKGLSRRKQARVTVRALSQAGASAPATSRPVRPR